ncbi:uncharacterized protein PV09_01793 [Verruconis gallopava]|uniref:DUF7704 domain-containing protein n=1 Tax=Verruconis gallopava TaxID=253628 RepID=A0A0D2AMY8_9PEZI|nr:uncharacterized protein PV09_01793 [Verruconis gallopava]KIW07880.1 hypothetical protein PV09_01793 [Verruconis gallopava]
MASLLPTIPRVIFTVLEPISLVAGFLAPLVSSEYFIASQLVRPYSGTFDETSKLLSWQLGNCYLLLGLLGVFILNTTTELKTVKAYIWALWLGDIGHVGFSVYAMGLRDTMAVGSWSATVWGNIGATVFLFLARSLYLLGVFDRKPSRGSGREHRSRKIKAKAR